MLGRLLGEGIELRMLLAGSVAKIRGDKDEIEQVVMNLVVNSRDALPKDGKITIQTADVVLDEHYAAEHPGVTPGAHVMLAISDSGVGMDQATQARIFEPFFTTKEAGKGTGLGLATVYGIVEQAGGKIDVDTALGIGSTFFVYLPAVGPGEPEPEPDDDGESTRVLVVEDEDAVRDLVTSVLEEDGYRVYAAANGRQALDLLERHPGIGLVLSDVVMPDLNGPELVARLQTLRPSAKVLFMSGYADSHLVSRGVNEASVKILHKPFSPAKLSEEVAALRDSLDEEPD